MTAVLDTGTATTVVQDVTVRGPLGTIVHGVSFRLGPGHTLAIVGESGSGKSLTARAISGLLPRGVSAAGEVRIGDAEVQLDDSATAWGEIRGSRVAMLLQDPFTSLSAAHRCGDQIEWTLDARCAKTGERLSRTARRAAILRHLDEMRLPERVAGQYPSELSGGMRQRVAIAAALAADPMLFIADEPTTALDANVQHEVLELLRTVQRERQMALIVISHDLGLVRDVAEQTLVLYAGRVVERGDTADVMSAPAHPYTAALHASEPPLEHRLVRLPVIPGRVPSPGEATSGCVFADRCGYVEQRCRVAEPPLAPVGADSRLAACFVSTGAISSEPARSIADSEPAQNADLLLSATGIVKAFGGRQVLHDVSVTVGDGECVGIIGESGSGKTTLARCIAGLTEPDAGEIVFRGTALTTRGRRADQIQVVFQDPYSALNPKLRVASALAEALRAGSGSSPTLRTPKELLELVGLPPDFVRKYPYEMSGGERQRVAIARALGPAPELLICDESVSALDVSIQAQILNLLNDLREQLSLSILFISHDLAVVRQISDRVYVMNDGRIVESGFTGQVLGAPTEGYTRELVAAVAR